MDFGGLPGGVGVPPAACGHGCWTTIPACRRPRRTTSTGPAWPPGTDRCTKRGSFACRGPRRSAATDCRPSSRSSSTRSCARQLGTPPRPSLGYLVQGILEHGSEEVGRRLVPNVNGRDRWCQDSVSPMRYPDLASFAPTPTATERTTCYRAEDLDQLLRRGRVVPPPRPHRPRPRSTTAFSAFAVPMRRRDRAAPSAWSTRSREFGEVHFDGARVPAADVVKAPGRGLGIGDDGRRHRASRASWRLCLRQDGQRAAPPGPGRPRPMGPNR